MSRKNVIERNVPYLVVQPKKGRVRDVINLFADILTTALKDGVQIRRVYRVCEGTCRKNRKVEVTPHLAIKMPSLIWYGCLQCGAQTLVNTRKPDALFELPPAEQKYLAENEAGMKYNSNVSARARKRRQYRADCIAVKIAEESENENC